MNENNKSHRTQIIVSVIGVIGAIAVAVVSQVDWNGPSGTGAKDSDILEPSKHTDALQGFMYATGWQIVQ